MSSEEHATLGKFRREITSGALALMLLGMLDRIGEPTYGYDLARRLAEHAPGGEAPRQGTLYPALRSLEKLGLLASTVEPSTAGPPRKYYRLTDDGRDALAAWRTEWTRLSSYVDAVLDPTSEPRPTDASDTDADAPGDQS
jgi:PadR family transcriptional regulator PadR